MSKDNTRKDVLFVGNIIKRKGLLFLIESIIPFLKQNKNVIFRIVGKKENKKIFSRIERTNKEL